MTRTRGTVVAGAALLLAAAAWAQAEPFREVRYLGGLPGVSRVDGTLEVRGAELRFSDRKGRLVFSRLLVPATAWVGQEKATSDGCVARNLALLPLLLPLAANYGGNPWLGGCGRTRSVVELRIGEGGEAVVVRFRAREERVRALVGALNAGAVTAPPAPDALGPVPE
jgi:hypothetical protein